MPRIPRDQVSAYDPARDDRTARADNWRLYAGVDDPNHSPHAPPGTAPAHLTMRELAARWKRTPKTVMRHYAAWGLRPLRFGGRLLFPFQQILECEERAQRGELLAGSDHE